MKTITQRTTPFTSSSSSNLFIYFLNISNVSSGGGERKSCPQVLQVQRERGQNLSNNRFSSRKWMLPEMKTGPIIARWPTMRTSKGNECKRAQGESRVREEGCMVVVVGGWGGWHERSRKSIIGSESTVRPCQFLAIHPRITVATDAETKLI